MMRILWVQHVNKSHAIYSLSPEMIACLEFVSIRLQILALLLLINFLNLICWNSMKGETATLSTTSLEKARATQETGNIFITQKASSNGNWIFQFAKVFFIRLHSNCAFSAQKQPKCNAFEAGQAFCETRGRCFTITLHFAHSRDTRRVIFVNIKISIQPASSFP